MKFARIIELEDDNQLLLSVEYSSDNDCYELIMKTDLDGCILIIAPGFDRREQAMEAMSKYTKKDTLEMLAGFFNVSV